jgi:hypothetical protein
VNVIDFIPHLEIQVAEHCNLNCASCTHFSPLAKESYIAKEDFSSQLKRANLIFNGHCKSLKIMGGEPLLHPEIAELQCLARKAMPEIKITLQTNGILLTGMSEEFWNSCRNNDIFVRVTRYPIKLNEDEIKRLAQQYNVNLKFHPEETIKSFNLYPLSIDGQGDSENNLANCKMKLRYVLIKNGRLFPCPIAGNAEHFNITFNQQLGCCEQDSISLDDVHSFEDYAHFATRPLAFCKHCLPNQYRRDIGWTHSKKAISEWT